MASTVKTRTHYAVLGLKPEATADEIGQAFAREISIFRPHTVGGVADVTVAYETLRNPAKRRAYDESIGIVPKPKPQPKPAVLTSRGVGHATFMGSMERPGMPHAVAELPPAVAPRRDPPPARSQPIGAALRELARPAPLHDAVPPKADAPAGEKLVEFATVPSDRATSRDADPSTMQSALHGPPPHPSGRAEPSTAKVELQLFDDAELDEPNTQQWKRLGLVAGGVVLAVAVAGAWAGSRSGDVPQNAASATVALTPPTTYSVTDPAQAAALDSTVPSPALDTPRPAARRAVRHTPRSTRTGQLAATPAPVEVADAQPAGPVAAPGDAPLTDAPAAASVVPANLPLSNGTIARTIKRIGYPCGSVTSTSQVLGGVYTVTCSSGHTYRAAPVRGRYHFRKVASR